MRNAWLVAIMALGFTTAFAPSRLFAQVRDTTTQSGSLDGLVELVRTHYVSSVTRQTLTAAACDGLLRSLDPYSRYIDPSEYAGYLQMKSGTFGGIGIRLATDSVTSGARILAPFEGSPALRAGLRSGDVVTEVDGRPATGKSPWELASEIQGKVGTVVRLTIRHSAVGRERHVEVRRAMLPTSTLRGLRRAPDDAWDYLADRRARIGYVRIEEFTASTPHELDAALAILGRAGARSLIVDLRQNPGGLMRGAIETADRFLESGVILRLHAASGDTAYDARPGAAALPLVLLIDEGTASAAEIFAAALQDHGRAKVLGTRSFGKGRVQEIYPLEGGGAIKLTASEWLRPSGAPLERHIAGPDTARAGVWPDSGLAMSDEPDAHRRWADRLWALDLTIPYARGQGERPEPPADPILDRAVAMLAGRAPR
jgi:carboxyl-terminal processing protease